MDWKLANDNRYWKLSKFTVNGIDSTDDSNFGNYTSFRSCFLRGLKESTTSGLPSFYNRFYQLGVSLEHNRTVFRVSGVIADNYTYSTNNNRADSCTSTNI